MQKTVIGIDVGGKRKGFHAVALRDGRFVEVWTDVDPVQIAAWCQKLGACVVAVDAPCAWSKVGSSRLAERKLKIGGETVQCFKTPTRERALTNRSNFYGWVFNGEQLFRELMQPYTLFDGQQSDRPTVMETFPHAVACALAGKVIPAKPKGKTRREALLTQGYDVNGLRNIDLVDAALCAVAAETFRQERWTAFGDAHEGFIVVPKHGTSMP